MSASPTTSHKDSASIQHQDPNQVTSATNHATQIDDTKLSEEAMKNNVMSKKSMKRIQPEKIAEVGEWKAEKEGEEADEEDNAELSTGDSTST